MVMQLDPVVAATRNPSPGTAPARSRKTYEVRRPTVRYLRGYAFDPSYSTQLATAFMNHVRFKVAWEDDLAPGPVGEYVEVVDYDPPSHCFYEPVDLNDRWVLAQDGLPPSEGSPQFHQQMAYAVAMVTIRNFEHALGRRAFWRPLDPDEGSPGGSAADYDDYVQRLRIYPHALREANAYYSPQKRALLFGYFLAAPSFAAGNFPGGLVFACLSHDVVAHETTHALLDGMLRRYIELAHPDGPAFHEAFADIVALLQHFTFPEVVTYQIMHAHGDMASENMLAQLAVQLGAAIGNYGALRDAIGTIDPVTKTWQRTVPDPNLYRTQFEPHGRGSILVAAVFDAFAAIYKNRTAALFRIATGGTGVLPAGDISTDLVGRLVDEATRIAQILLTICIRALDYCPPVNITFGDYLRAMVTADLDLVVEDDWGFRLAIIESFRKWGILPEWIRTLSLDTLRWPGADERMQALFAPVAKHLRDSSYSLQFNASRRKEYDFLQGVAGNLDKFIQKVVLDSSDKLQELEELTGISLAPNSPLPGLRLSDGPAKLPKFEVSVRLAQRAAPDGSVTDQVVIVLTQTRDIPADAVTGQPPFKFRGGCTLIVDLRTLELQFRIVKRIDDDLRLQRQAKYMGEQGLASLRATYLGALSEQYEQEPFALLHRQAGGEENL